MSENSTSEKNPPIKKFRVGNVTASVWERTTSNGVFHNVSLQRSYKDENGQIQNSGSFGFEDFGALQKCVDMASKFLEQKVEEAHA